MDQRRREAVVILGMDTASSVSSIALVDRGEVIAAEQVEGSRQHAEALAPMLARLLDAVDADEITAVACDVGPGPYSGLRVAIASAIACGLAWNVPVYGVCSLDVVAAEVVAAGEAGDGFGVALDARRREVYWARYSASGDRLAGPRVGSLDAIPAEFAIGSWVDARVPHAKWVARMVEWLLLDDVVVIADDVPLTAHADDGSATADALIGRLLLPPRPLYLRRPDVTISSANAGARA